MLRFVFKRILSMIPTIIGITLLIFVIMSIVPGDPARLALGIDATEDQIEAFREEQGLNEPFLVRYFNYMAGVLHGDFGTSWYNHYDVGAEIKTRLSITLVIALGSMIVQIIVGLPIGIIAAVKQYSFLDTSITGISMLLTSAPTFWVGLLLMLLFCLNLQWLPAIGTDSWKNFVLPIITQSAGIMAAMIRTTRSNMLECIREDYVRTARAKGAKENSIIFRDVLKNALLPIVTVVGMNFGMNMSGAIVMETIYAMPGLGSLVYGGLASRDMPVVMGCMIFMSIFICAANLIVDILYAFIDPRVKAQYIAESARARAKRKMKRAAAIGGDH